MKKLAVVLSVLFMSSIAGACLADEIFVSCPCEKPKKEKCHKEKTCDPCEKEKSCKDCEGTYEDKCLCGDACETKEEFFAKRCDMYKELGLSGTQASQARTLDDKYFGEIYSLRTCYQDAKRELEKMQCEKVCKDDIKTQKDKVEDLKKQIDDKKEAYNDDFMCLLTDCQKKEYKHKKQDKCWVKK